MGVKEVIKLKNIIYKKINYFYRCKKVDDDSLKMQQKVRLLPNPDKNFNDDDEPLQLCRLLIDLL